MVDTEFEAVTDGGFEVFLTVRGNGFAVCGGVVPALNESHSTAGDDGHL